MSFGNSPPRGRRAVPRTEAPLAVELLADGITRSATLGEISRTGAKLSGVSHVKAGQELQFRAGNVHALGEVVWAEGDRCAIAFDIPIGSDEVSRLRSLANFVRSVNAVDQSPASSHE